MRLILGLWAVEKLVKQLTVEDPKRQVKANFDLTLHHAQLAITLQSPFNCSIVTSIRLVE